jgi:tubulin--tyrosine ligase-like protein 12
MRVNEDDENLGYKCIYTNEEKLDANDSNSVFLIDHAWTYRVNDARSNLIEMEGLLDRMCNLMSISIDSDESDEVKKKLKVEAVFEKMWKFNQTYKLYTNQLV